MAEKKPNGKPSGNIAPDPTPAEMSGAGQQEAFAERVQTISSDDTAAQEAAAQAYHAQLPPPGYARQEQMRIDANKRYMEAEAIADRIMTGSIDVSALQRENDIANNTQYLRVSNPQPGWVYRWVSKNRYGQHIQKAKMMGWLVVQGNDPEAIELKGGGMHGMGVGSPGTTRELGDVMLLKIPHEKWIVLQALAIARQRKIQQASSANLVELASKYSNVMTLHTWRMQGGFDGPEVRSHALGRRPLNAQGGSKPDERSAYPQNLAELEASLRHGTTPQSALQAMGAFPQQQ